MQMWGVFSNANVGSIFLCKCGEHFLMQMWGAFLSKHYKNAASHLGLFYSLI